MGHDIQPISRHNLDVSSIKALAEDLAERFKTNTNYGFYNALPELGILIDPQFTGEGYIPFGKIQSAEYKDFADLYDEDFTDRELYEKYGDAFEERPEYKKYYSSVRMSELYHSESKFPDYSFHTEIEGEQGSVNIFKYSLVHRFYYLSRWWSFCRAILEDGFNDNYKSLNEYRKKLMDFTIKTGGDKIYFVDDQAFLPKGIGQGGEMSLSWEEIEETIIKEIGPSIINIPDIVTNSIERTPYMDDNEYSLVFVDDFRDLK